MPTVSVVMIFLNPRPFFQEAIDSVFAQSFSDWELVLVDDGSSDGSTELARRLAAENPAKIRYFAHWGRKNRGTSASRTLGSAKAKGQYLAFLDSDDVWLPEYLETQIQLLQEHTEAGAVFGGTKFWFTWPGSLLAGPEECYRKQAFPTGTLVEPGQFLVPWISGTAETPGTCSFVVRRDTALRYPYEGKFRGLFEDQVFLYKLALHERIYSHDKVLSLYRMHPNSTCHVAMREGEFERLHGSPSERRFFQWLRRYLANSPAATGAMRTEVDRKIASMPPARPIHDFKRRFKRGLRRLIRRAVL